MSALFARASHLSAAPLQDASALLRYRVLNLVARFRDLQVHIVLLQDTRV